jgi:hypothetical protein
MKYNSLSFFVLGAPQRHRQLRFPGFNPAGYEQQMIDEFDQLSALDQLCRAEGCRYGVLVAGAGEDLHGSIGEFDHVRVSVPDRLSEDSPGCLLEGKP